MTEFDTKRVLITGAARGIGKLLAREFGALGAELILWDIDAETLRATAAELVAAEVPVAIDILDLRDPAAIRSAAGRALSEQGPIDVLINNAGVVSGKGFVDATVDEIQRTLDVNALAPIRVTHAILPSMIERDRGHIVNISSAAGIVGSARLVDYCASKFALFGFDEALRIELRHAGSSVQTTIVCPYYVDTGMFAGARSRFSWLLPILDPVHVTERIVRAVRTGRRRVILPWFVYAGWPVRVLPVAMFDWLIDLFGISRGMDEFRGRPR